MRAFIFARQAGTMAMACVLAAMACVGVGSCGGGGMVTTTPPDGGQDLATDADARVGVTCSPVPFGQQRGLGGCCAKAADCAGGVCWDGFCTKTCAGAADCGPVVAPSPLPVGTPMACAPNMLGETFSYCMPGSLQACSPGAACPTGEDCALSLDPLAVPPGGAARGVYAGACLTKLIATPFLPAGSACEPEQGPYACENQGGYLGSGCVARRCTRACRQDAACPYGMFCGPTPYSPTEGGVSAFMTLADVGICLGRPCGQVHGQAGLATGQVTQQGADAVCPTGEICTPTVAVGATGDTAYLSCVLPRQGAAAYGMPCGMAAGSPRCADDSLCVSRAGAPASCSTLCRNDRDCPTGSFCMDDFVTKPLPNGSVARLAMCAPRASIVGTSCQGEKDCAATQTCLPAGTRSGLLLCQPAVGTKEVGASCAAPGECRSGACVDRDLHNPNGQNRTACGGFCGKNSDCGTGQICLTVVLNNNLTTDDPTDDLILGYCTTLDAPARAGACRVDADCAAQVNPDEMGGDSCDPVHLTCFKKTATIGAACSHRAECPLGAYCRLNDPRFVGGACLSRGCDPLAVAGVDACPVGSVCTQRPSDRPINGCYEACSVQVRCSREAEKYSCDLSGTSAAAPICLWNGGT